MICRARDDATTNICQLLQQRPLQNNAFPFLVAQSRFHGIRGWCCRLVVTQIISTDTYHGTGEAVFPSFPANM